MEARVPATHPLRTIRTIVNEVLDALDTEFEVLYEGTGRQSVAPERLLRASLLQAFYSVRSERQLMEQINYNLLFRWFVGLGIDDAVWDHSTFSKNRERLLGADVAAKFLAAVLRHPQVTRFLSDEHFSVDGTLVEAWASLKSFRAKDGSDEPPAPGRNGERDFHDEKRSNETHASTTDPDARLYRKGSSQAAKLSYMGHASWPHHADQVALVRAPAWRTPAAASPRAGWPRTARSAPGRSSRRRRTGPCRPPGSSAMAPQVSSTGHACLVGPVQLIEVDASVPRRARLPRRPPGPASGRKPEPSGDGATFEAMKTSSRRPATARPDERLRDALAVDLGRVDPVDAGVEGGVHGRDDRVLGLVGPPIGAARPPTRRSRSRRVGAVRSELSCLHGGRIYRKARDAALWAQYARSRSDTTSTPEVEPQGAGPIRPTGMTKTVEEKERVVIRFAGDSGDGMQLTGDRFTSATAVLGNDLATLPDFPAEIRAPAGTVHGVSAFQIQFASTDITTPGDHADVLVAMNPAALKADLHTVEPRRHRHRRTRTRSPQRNIEKAGYAADPRTDGTLEGYQIFRVPMTSITVRATEEHRHQQEGGRAREEHVRAGPGVAGCTAGPTETTLGVARAQVRRQAGDPRRERRRLQGRLQLRRDHRAVRPVATRSRPRPGRAGHVPQHRRRDGARAGD